MSPTFSPPGEYNEFNSLRPGTPGTMTSFGRNSAMSNYEKYDRDTPSAMGLLPPEDGSRGQRSSTYYFDKEGGSPPGSAASDVFRQYQGRRGTSYGSANYSAASSAAALEKGGLAGAAGAAAARKRPGFIRRRPLLCALIALVVLAIIGAGAAVGVAMSHKSNNKNLSASSDASNGNKGNSGSSGTNSNTNSNSNNNNSGSSSSNSAGGNRGNGSSNSSTPKITPFQKWSWTDVNTKAYGVSVGSWLVLERWLIEDWMVQEGGADAWDEWTFTENLGSKAASVLQSHYNSWVTESDMDTLQNAGVNVIRIPIPFWAFIPTVSPEPYVSTGIMDQLNKMLAWCYNRGMYVMLDLHAMPGSQNGDQSSGRNTTDIEWFSQQNQDRSDTFLNNVLQWATSSNYSSIINGIEAVNEPRIVNDNWALNQTRFQITQSYYERSYATCLKYGVPMSFHNGFAPGTVQQKMDLWAPFVSGKDPSMLIYEDHPYPGWFQTPEPGQAAIQTSVCEYGTAAQNFGIPVLMGEFSAIQSAGGTSYAQTYLQMQLATYGQSAGSIFWNFKAQTSQNPVLALSGNLMQLYSYVDILANNYMPNPGKGGNVRNFYAGLPNPCGGYQTYGWANPAQ